MLWFKEEIKVPGSRAVALKKTKGQSKQLTLPAASQQSEVVISSCACPGNFWLPPVAPSGAACEREGDGWGRWELTKGWADLWLWLWSGSSSACPSWGDFLGQLWVGSAEMFGEHPLLSCPLPRCAVLPDLHSPPSSEVLTPIGKTARYCSASI